MDAQKIHWLLNHYPIIVLAIGVAVLFIGVWRNSDGTKRASMMVIALSALVTLPVFVTGEIGGAAAARNYSGPHAEALALHKNSARTAFLLMEAAGIVALVGLIFPRRRPTISRWMTTAVLLTSLAACGLIGYTTYIGRQVKWAGVESSLHFHGGYQLNNFGLKAIKSNNREMKLWHA
jgi:uncharacterized membrane protein